MSAQRSEGEAPDRELASVCLQRYASVVTSRVRGLDLRAQGIEEEDVEQDARIRIWSAQLREPDRLLPASYVARTAASSAIDALRRERARHRSKHEVLDAMPAELPHPDLSPEAVCERDQWLGRVKEGLDRLSERRRRPVSLILLGYSLSEAATASGLTLNSCTKLVLRGLEQLRQWLADASRAER